MDATQSTAPPQSSELTLTRVMSPNDHSCPICTQSMGNEIWVCCRCFAYGHPGCIQITVVEGYTFCQQCAAWAKNEVEKVKQQQQIVAWKETMQHQLEGWKKASIFAAGTLSTIGLAVGGTTAAIAHGSVALLRGVAAGAAAASSTGEQLQQAAAAARSTSLTADDSAKAATQNFLSLLPVPDPPAESTRPTRSTQRSPPGIAAAASDSGFCLACHTHNPSHVEHLYRGDCLKKKRPAVRSRSGSTQPTTRRTAPFAQLADTPTPEAAAQCQGGNADDKVQEEAVYAESNAGEDSRTKERSPTRDRPPSFQSADGDGWESGINAGGVMRALHDLSIEVRSGSTRMDVLMDSMTALESAMTSMIDRIDNLFTTTQELKEQMDKWNEHQDDGNDNTDEMFETLYAHETLYHDTATPRDATPVLSASPLADDSQARQNEASAGVDEFSTMNPAGPVALLPRNSVDPRRELLVQIGRDTATRRIDQPSPGFGNFGLGSIPCEQGPTTGGLPASPRPLSDSGGGSLGGQAPGLSLQHELLKREMNQQLVRYHVPAQMQVSAPQARVHEDLRFRGPGGSEAGGVSRGVNSEMSDHEPTAPEMSGPSMREEIPVTELNVLLKFLQTLGDLPKIDFGEPASRGERLAVWRTAVEAQLRTTRRVVMEWWQWSYAGAEIYYNHWLKLPLLQRNQIKISEDMPMRFQTVEDWFFPRFLLCVPTKLKDAVIQEQTYGANFRVMDVLFKLMALMQPKGVEEQDALVKQLTDPNPCRDPMAALRELKRWFTSVKRAVDIGMTKLGAALSRCAKHLLWSFRG